MKNKLILITGTFLIAAMLVSLVSAFGVSSPYWEGNPLRLAKGEVRVVNLNLQNMVGDHDVTVKADLIEGTEITSIEGDTFVVEANTADTIVPLTIEMPKEIETGEKTTVKVEFKTVKEDNSGISMGTGMSVAFDVVATDKTAESNTTTIIAVIVVILGLAVVLFMLLKRKRK